MSHSLGAKVILTALNILAETHQKAIDHVFLWQPAVADNALSNKVENDTHPFGAGVFPQAHKATKQIIVLHSSKDGVLDGHDTTKNLFEDINNGNVSEAMTGLAGGAYRKKWWDITLFKAGIKVVLDPLYKNYQPLTVNRMAQDDDQSMEQLRIKREKIEVEKNWKRLEQDLKQEMQRNLSYKKHPHKIPEYQLLAPIAINRIVDKQAVDNYIQRLKAYYNGEHKASPRPALGYEGFKTVKGEDDFIRDMLVKTKNLEEVDQVKWLFDHSGMKTPSKELFEKVYVEVIWKRFLSNSGFGLYELKRNN